MKKNADETIVGFGPCCFCAKEILESDIDPCRVTVETAAGKWQVWSCHAVCFRKMLTSNPEYQSLFEPAHF